MRSVAVESPNSTNAPIDTGNTHGVRSISSVLTMKNNDSRNRSMYAARTTIALVPNTPLPLRVCLLGKRVACPDRDCTHTAYDKCKEARGKRDTCRDIGKRCTQHETTPPDHADQNPFVSAGQSHMIISDSTQIDHVSE